MQINWSQGTAKILLLLILVFYTTRSIDYPIYTSSCVTESATRLCTQRNNLTQYILSLKKGGTNILSNSDYDKNFFLCEEYTFDCGYVEDENQTVSIANGIQLKMTNAEVDAVLPSNATLATKIKSYLNMSAQSAKGVFQYFPLSLTATESDLFFTNYMNILMGQIKTKYAAEKLNTSKVWADVNVNIRTAVAEVIKEDNSLLSGSFWEDFRWNNFTEMASYLKDKFRETNKLYYQRSAYLIDSVSKRCNKYQSVNFLVDESGSITAPAFRLALDFLIDYVTRTYDDPALMSVHFYDDAFDPYLDYGKTKAQLLSAINTKYYRASGTLTGQAINATISKIEAANFEKGLNKVMVVMTDGFSFDNVLYASDYARSKGITMIAVGIGAGANDIQLLEIAQTQSNVIKVSSYADLDRLVSFIENFFCKQIIDIKLNDTVAGNVVRVPQSPSYFRLERSPTVQVYEMRIKFNSDPDLGNTTVQISQFDPFPDEFSYYRFGKRYKISPHEISYFIYPAQESQLRVKKKLFTVQNFLYVYLAIAGINMQFNVSLAKCSTVDCSMEKATYEATQTPVIIPTPDSTSDDSDISNSVYATSCPAQSPSRVCPQKGNLTEYLISLKKGGSDILSLADYNKNFFVCQEYAFDCGYVQNENQTVSIANGIQLKMNATQIDTILPTNTTLANTIKTYAGLTAQDAKCGMKIYPLVLTPAENDLFFTNYMNLLVNEIKTKYLAQKSPSSLSWTDLNINIKTAVSEVVKENRNMMSNEFWTSFKTNNWTAMSTFLKQQYQMNNQNMYCLRSSYLIDSVTQKCNKYQSINFLIDESGSIGWGNFNLTLQFLEQFINTTNDDPSMMSIHFYDAAFDPYLDYNKTKAQLITGLRAKTYRAGGTYTGQAIKSAVDRIVAAGLGEGVGRILIVVTDGQSYDQVVTSANYAKDQKVTVLAVGVGPGVNDTQMLEIAQSATNVIKVSSFPQLTKLAKYIGNFLCKQIIDLKLNSSSTGHSVKVPESPTYFKIQKSPSQTLQLRIKYDSNPDTNNVSLYTSDYDPFPNELSEYSIPEAYKISETQRAYYISSVRISETRKKKSYFKLFSFMNSFVAVAGNNVKFNLTLAGCNSTGCAANRTVAGVRVFDEVKVNELRHELNINPQLQQTDSIQQSPQSEPLLSNQSIVYIGTATTIFMILLVLALLFYTNYSKPQLQPSKTQKNQSRTTNFDPEMTEEQFDEKETHPQNREEIQAIN